MKKTASSQSDAASIGRATGAGLCVCYLHGWPLQCGSSGAAGCGRALLDDGRGHWSGQDGSARGLQRKHGGGK